VCSSDLVRATVTGDYTATQVSLGQVDLSHLQLSPSLLLLLIYCQIYVNVMFVFSRQVLWL